MGNWKVEQNVCSKEALSLRVLLQRTEPPEEKRRGRKALIR
jgi:hypothetical protein